MALSKNEMKILAACKSAIESIDATAEVVLYGSRARGDATDESDYDLLIISDSQVTTEAEDRFRRALYDLQLETATVITVLMVNRDQWDAPLSRAMPLHQNIEREGISL